MRKSLKITAKIISTLIVLAILAFALLVGGIRIFGVEVYTILSGSMRPNYEVGDMIYVLSAERDELQAGDVITFKLANGTIATHRIVKLVPDEENPSEMLYVTKGDANEVEDGALSYDRIIGKLWFHIPGLGKFASDIQSPPGIYYALAAGMGIILAVFLMDMAADGKFSKTKVKNGSDIQTGNIEEPKPEAPKDEPQKEGEKDEKQD